MSGLVAELRAQAKINLFLRVLAREETGYHTIETLFCRLELADRVRIRIQGEGCALRVSGHLPPAGLGPPEANLAWRAAELFARSVGWPPGLEIELEKRIPAGAGLGGGSADAAAVLRLLNALTPTPLAPQALLDIALSLGADVPFLTQDSSTLALGWGRGERLLTLPTLPQRRCWILWPGVPVFSAEAYAWLDESPRARQPALLPLEATASWQGLATVASNDFEPVVSERLPVVSDLLLALRSGAVKAGKTLLAGISGSGSAVFAVDLDGLQDGEWLQGILPAGVEAIQTTTATRVEPIIIRH